MTSSANGLSKRFLVVQRGAEIGTRIELRDLATTIGRNPDNLLVLDDQMVSRYHAILRYDLNRGQFSIIDLGSTNGVVVNDLPIDPGVPHPLKQRDTIFIGKSIFSLQIQPDDYRPHPKPSRDNDPFATKHLDMAKLFS